MTTLEMEIAVMQHFDVRKKLIVTNPSWGVGLHECDVLVLSRSGYATEIEIKISKGDLIADKKKKHGHVSPWIKTLFFAVPEDLLGVCKEHCPENAGILVVKPGRNSKRYGRQYDVREARPAVSTYCKKWSAEKRYALARLGAIRALGAKRKILELKNKLDLQKCD